MKAVVYNRISSDPSGQKAGVARQERECRELAEVRGWDVVGVYTDNDRSAYSGKPRPEYERLLVDIDSGVAGSIIAWHPDRLHRSPVELEDFIDLVEKRGVTVATVQGGEYDLSTPSGRMTARVVGAVARHESEHKAERQKSKASELAREGKPSGGGHRPFGYEDDRVTIRESEAAHIRQAAKRVLRGESQRSIVRDWNKQGVGTVEGKPWASFQLRRTLSSARIAGLRSHRGEVVAKATWPGIISEADHYALNALFQQNIGAGRRHPRKYLLTGGIGVCGLCNAKLVARPRGDGRRSYVCASGPGFAGCGKIRALAEPLEDWVRDAVIESVAGEGLAAALAEVTGDSAATLEELNGLEESLEQLARDHYADKRIGQREFFAARDAITQRVEGLKADLAVGQAGRFASTLPSDAEGLREMYDAQPLEWRQQFVSLVVERLVANPAVKGRNFFDSARFKIVWRA